jgi:chromosomal replication initiation ATPase DnaA
MSQLPLDLRHRPALGRGDFLVAPPNAKAMAWIDRWPDWPATALALVGPPGSGKSHLAEVWREAAGAPALQGGDLAAAQADRLLGSATALLVEGADAKLSAEQQETLLHLYNLLAERRGHLLLTGRDAPKRWPLQLPDLVSRLATAPVAELGPPDDALLQAVLVKLCSDRQLDIGADAVAYLQTRIPRSFAAAQTVANALDLRTLAARQRRVTVPTARAVLEAEADRLATLDE